MQFIIQNECLKVAVNDLGAELNSIQTSDGTEYLWQADTSVWDGQAPNLFPYIARLTNETYTYKGKMYHLPIHGFINQVKLEGKMEGKEKVTFCYRSNEETLKCYPFAFVYTLTYELKGNVLKIENKVENQDEKRMFFGIGGHPGFCVPLEEGLAFEDYYLEFESDSNPSRVIFTPDCFLTGKEETYPLNEKRKILLRHDLFCDDAIVLKNAAHGVSIRSDKGKKSVKVNYPDANIIGFWHMPKMEANYVCIEPWSSLPSRKSIIEDISQQSDLIALDAGKTYTFHWEIEIKD